MFGEACMELFHHVLAAVNDVLWHDVVLYLVLAVGVGFTIWTRLGQVHAMTHGIAVTAGRYDRADDPGAIKHF